jgi:hypothetical protein
MTSTTRVVTADRYAWMTPIEGVPGRYQHNVAARGDEIAVSAEEAKRGEDLGLLAQPGAAEPAGASASEPKAMAAGDDPADFKVEEVQAYLAGADDAEKERVLAAEAAGKNRTSLTGS